MDISNTYDSCLTCQLSGNDKEGRRKHSCKSALDMERKKIATIFFAKIPSKNSLRINWKYLFKDESDTDKNICFNECFISCLKEHSLLH